MTEYTNIRVPKEVHAAIKKVADKSGRTIISELSVIFGVKRK